MAWVDTASETFVARHDERDADDADRVLAQLEFARTRLEERFDPRPGELAVVLHSSVAQLDAAQPWLPLARRLPPRPPPALPPPPPPPRPAPPPLRGGRRRPARAARAVPASTGPPRVQR